VKTIIVFVCFVVEYDANLERVFTSTTKKVPIAGFAT
jgi:hypothetical protein